MPSQRKIQRLVAVTVQRLNELHGAFDFVLIDTQPSETALHDVFAYVSNWFVIPTWLAEWSFGQTVKAVAAIDEYREQFEQRGIYDRSRVLAIVPNYALGFQTEDQDMLTLLRESYGDLVMSPIPKRKNILGQALAGPHGYHMIPEFMSLVQRVEETIHERA